MSRYPLVKGKAGRSYLAKVLSGAEKSTLSAPKSITPDVGMLDVFLWRGPDPNQAVGSSTVWPQYLRGLGELFQLNNTNTSKHFETICRMKIYVIHMQGPDIDSGRPESSCNQTLTQELSIPWT